MFQLRHLRTFVAAAETLNFTRAAERVHLAQPSVTEQVRALEDTVGRPLFLRRHNTLALTPAGAALLVRARELLAMADDALRAVKGEGESASLALSAPETLATSVLAPLVADHARQHPGLRVSLRTRNSAETVADVTSGAAALGLLHGGPLPDADLASEVLAHDRAVVVMLPSHALATHERVHLADLAGTRLGATTAGCTYRTYLDAQCMPHGLAIAFEAGSVAALLALVAGGMGVCVVPRLAFVGSSSALVARPLADVPPLPVSLLRRPAVSPTAGRFAQVLRANARSLDEAMSALDV
jgi:DNA-binding transcriptional LysR family regulator